MASNVGFFISSKSRILLYCATTALSMSMLACSGGGPLGDVEPLAPFVKARHHADAAVRLINQEFDSTDSQFTLGLLRYNRAYASVNTLIDQLVLSIAARAKLPDLSTDTPTDQLSENDLRVIIQSAITDGENFRRFVETEVCDKINDDNDEICRQVRASGLAIGIADISLNSLVDSVLNFIEAAEARRDTRRKQIIDQLNGLKLKPLNEITSTTEE